MLSVRDVFKRCFHPSLRSLWTFHQVAIPAVSENGKVMEWSELEGGKGSGTGSGNGSGGGGSGAIERIKNRDYDGSLYMVNKPPRWNDQVEYFGCVFIQLGNAGVGYGKGTVRFGWGVIRVG